MERAESPAEISNQAEVRSAARFDGIDGKDLRTLAAEIQQVLLSATTDAALLAASKALGALMQVDDDTDVLPRLIASSPGYELMVSNLRVLSFASARNVAS